ncbi:uncharacterized GPI-anchored protein At1g61900-like [Impatiens glandulifera]|uniref:uncharacterized GPI-anchored protein At1g61900-like n=1 Tax=Impatiens glandulifera TaxID=253017 RepID=UPI001FB07EA6|nr:uncharacterized GPI-anchored protein At1g61900-like [Impatiens glandulifera]
MDYEKTVTHLTGSHSHPLLLLIIWLSISQSVFALEIKLELRHMLSLSELSSPPDNGLFQPIAISPAVIPHNPFPDPTESLPPMYPTLPTTYDPVLTGKCPVNLSELSSIMDKTALDCARPFTAFVGNVICCPQFGSLLRIFKGYYSIKSNELVLKNATATDCFSDIVSILASRRANSSIPTLCSAKPSNLTGESCPVKELSTFEKTVNTSTLLESCSSVDPLKECCRPICQPAIMEAALKLSAVQTLSGSNGDFFGGPNTVNDCKDVVYSWISRKLSLDAANSAFRILSACKVNKVCPLNLENPSEVIKACKNVAAPSPSCCSSLNSYIGRIQKQMLITNKQAIICSTLLGSILQKGGVITNVYELCDVDLKDFSLQAFEQGCLLRSLPVDMVYDNVTGLGFSCDLNGNIVAPWPSSSSVTSFSLCAPEMSLPALPTSENLGNPGYHSSFRFEFLVPHILSSIIVFSTLLY